MEGNNYIPIVFQGLLALGLLMSIIALSNLFGAKRQKNTTQNKAYECGVYTETFERPRLEAKFYVIGILFILFDIEIAFLIPWAVVYREFIQLKIAILTPGLIFLATLGLGLLYTIKKRVL